MDINANFVANAYAANRPATAPQPGSGSGAEAFGNVAQDFLQTLQNSDLASMDAMTSRADPHALVQALAQAELAVETATTIRNKVVEAYQEILRMPV